MRGVAMVLALRFPITVIVVLTNISWLYEFSSRTDRGVRVVSSGVLPSASIVSFFRRQILIDIDFLAANIVSPLGGEILALFSVNSCL